MPPQISVAYPLPPERQLPAPVRRHRRAKHRRRSAPSPRGRARRPATPPACSAARAAATRASPPSRASRSAGRPGPAAARAPKTSTPRRSSSAASATAPITVDEMCPTSSPDVVPERRVGIHRPGRAVHERDRPVGRLAARREPHAQEAQPRPSTATSRRRAPAPSPATSADAARRRTARPARSPRPPGTAADSPSRERSSARR